MLSKVNVGRFILLLLLYLFSLFFQFPVFIKHAIRGA